MKVLITGAAGFLGSHLTDRLLAEGHEVIGLDNFLTGSRENLEQHARNPRFHLIEGSIIDRPLVSALMQAEHFDTVFHTAAIARTPWTIADPILSHDTTATGTLNVLEAARQTKVKRFVHSSSCIVYVPNTPYYVSKLAAEEYVRIYKELYGLSTIALRYSNIYGKRQSEKGHSPNVFAALRKAKKERGKIFITGDGEQTRDYTHVSDVVDANIRAANSEESGAYYVGTGVATSLNEVAPYFQCDIEYIEEREGDIKHLVRDGTEFKELFGWEPKIQIADGIVDVL